MGNILYCVNKSSLLLEMSKRYTVSPMLKTLTAVCVGLLLGYWFVHDNKLESIKGKRVLVTGASTGIGEQLAYQFARLGARVVVTARRKKVLEKVAKNCKAISPNNLTHHVVPGDMANLESTKDLIMETVNQLGGLDLLVLNHITPIPIQEFTGSQQNMLDFSKVMDVNFRSYVHLTSHALPYLKESSGSIVVINSLLGKVPHPYLPTYASSKHALTGFFGSLQSLFHSENIHVSVTSCTLGFIGTENSLQELEKSKSSNTLSLVSPASPQETAIAIVSAAAQRKRELYYPYMSTRPLVLFRSLFPEAIDNLLSRIFKPTS